MATQVRSQFNNYVEAPVRSIVLLYQLCFFFQYARQGYGNAVNVKRTVSGYARAGMAGIMIEDQVAPKR